MAQIGATLQSRAYRGRGIADEIAIPKSFIFWGILNLVVTVYITFFNQPWSALFRNGVFVSGGIWVFVGALGLRLPLRVVFPVALILLLQLWGAVSIFWTSGMIARSHEINYADFFLLRYLTPFFIAQMLVSIDEKYRRFVLWVVFINVGIGAATAFGQFFKFPPALELAKILLPGQDITNWDGRGGVRAIGLYGFPGLLALLCTGCCAVIVGRIFVRDIKWWETATFMFFACAGIMTQARSHMPGLFIVIVAFIVAIIAREGAKSSWIVSAVAGAGVLFFTVGQKQMAYLLSTTIDDPNLIHRRTVNWTQAALVEQYFPWTGLGPEPRFWGSLAIASDKWAPKSAFDNGWLLIQASYGFVGSALFALVLASMFVAAFIVYRDWRESDERAELCIAMAFIAIGVGIGSYGNNVPVWDPNMISFMCLGGAAMRTRKESLAFTKANLAPASMLDKRAPIGPVRSLFKRPQGLLAGQRRARS